MNSDLKREIEDCLAVAWSDPVTIVSSTPVGGGCINETVLVSLDDGQTCFVKLNKDVADDFFTCEVAGLSALASANAIRVPQVIGTGQSGATRFLILESVRSAAPQPNFSSRFGSQLALLHRRAQSEQFGWSHDNYLGSAQQPNAPCDDWGDFWRDRRLQYQWDWARKNGFSDAQWEKFAIGVKRRLDQILATDEPPCLLHGDLWSGNVMVGADGLPVLVDPACYFGHREAEFGMTTLFGGFDDRFYASYQEEWPLAPGSDERIEIYRLYHLLNHLNLFGAGYRRECLEIMKKFA